MGKSKILGGGAGKITNASVVEEFAGEEILANSFVAKLSGSRQAWSAARNIYRSLFIDDTHVVCVGISNVQIIDKRSGNIISSLNYTAMDSYATASGYYDIVCLPAKKIIGIFGQPFMKSSNEDVNLYYTLMSYDDNYSLSLICENLIINRVSTEWYGRVRAFSGVYNTDYIPVFQYALSTNCRIEQYSIGESSLELKQSIPLSSAPGSITNPGSLYIPEINAIFGSQQTSAPFTYRAVSCEDGQELFATDAVAYPSPPRANQSNYAIKNGHIYLVSDSDRTRITKFDLVSGATEEVTLTAMDDYASTLYSNCLINIPYNNGTKFFLIMGVNSYTQGRVYLIDFDNHTVQFYTTVPVYSGTYEAYPDNYHFDKGWSAFISKGYLYEVSQPHIELPQSSAIYGLSISKIKAFEKGKAYVYDEIAVNQTMSVYGVTEKLVNKIKNDSVIEIQNALVNGEER